MVDVANDGGAFAPEPSRATTTDAISMTSILVTGGAGYIGSHTCKALRQAGFTPAVYDDLYRASGFVP